MASPSTWIRNQLGLIEGSTVYEVKMLYITFMFVRKKENSVMCLTLKQRVLLIFIKLRGGVSSKAISWFLRVL